MGVVLSVILVISLVGWALSFLEGESPVRQLQDVPTSVPPARAAEVPRIDIHAPGRTSDKLAFWADPIAADTSISSAAIRAYANAELIAAESWPECHLSWGDACRTGVCGNSAWDILRSPV